MLAKNCPKLMEIFSTDGTLRYKRDLGTQTLYTVLQDSDTDTTADEDENDEDENQEEEEEEGWDRSSENSYHRYPCYNCCRHAGCENYVGSFLDDCDCEESNASMDSDDDSDGNDTEGDENGDVADKTEASTGSKIEHHDAPNVPGTSGKLNNRVGKLDAEKANEGGRYYLRSSVGNKRKRSSS
jgi:hypothetical protein